jgi:uncharacterized RDD family membrane protein YckC
MSPLGYRLRRLSAHFYDALLALALCMSLTLVLLPLNHGNALTGAQIGAWQTLYQLVLVAALSAYFVISWCRQGQTLGLKTWGLRLRTVSDQAPTLAPALRRLGVLLSLNILALGGIASLRITSSRSVSILLLLPWALNLCCIIIGGTSAEDRFSGLIVVPAQRARHNAATVTPDNSSNGNHATTSGDH